MNWNRDVNGFELRLAFFILKKKKESATATGIMAAVVTGWSWVEVVLKHLSLPGLSWSQILGDVFPLLRTVFILQVLLSAVIWRCSICIHLPFQVRLPDFLQSFSNTCR